MRNAKRPLEILQLSRQLCALLQEQEAPVEVI